MPKVIVIGSANVDFTITVERLPLPEETVLGRELYRSFGGKGANQAVAALMAGADTTLLAMLGADAHGQELRDHLQTLGLPHETLLRHETVPSGLAVILVEPAGRNVIAVVPGSNMTLSREDVRRFSSVIARGAVLLTQLEIPLDAVEESLRQAKAGGLLAILNPAPARPLPASLLALADILTPNEAEACLLTGTDDPDAAASELIARGAKTVIVTLGARGALLKTATRSRLFPAYRVAPVDSTAAGDAFHGALACALAEGRSLDAAVPFANAAGALATTRTGAQASLPRRDEIERLCR